MSNFRSALKVSASVIALAAASGGFGAVAHAVTITGNQVNVALGATVEDVTIASGATVSPGGVLITSIDGKLNNAGAVSMTDEDLGGDDLDASAVATGLAVGAVTKGVTNTGPVSATATAAANGAYEGAVTGGVTGTALADADANASGIVAGTVTGDFVTSGAVSADASAAITGTIDVTVDGAIDLTGATSTTVNSTGIQIDGLDGDFVNQADGAVSAAASSTVDIDADITADTGTARIGGAEGDVSAIGVQLAETDAAVNAGAITASATSSFSVEGVYDATAGGGALQVAYDYSFDTDAEGLLLLGAKSVDNSGTIVAEATGTVDLALSTISVAGNAAAITMGGEGSGEHHFSTTAYGIDGEIDGGDVSNSNGITATATGTATYDFAADATGSDATVWASQPDVEATARGIFVHGDIDDLVNSGTIAATATATLDITGGTVSDTSYGWTESEDGIVHASAAGIDASGVSGDAGNSGAVTATAMASLSLDGDAAGVSAYVTAIHTVDAIAAGIFVGGLDGSFSNTGTVAATASATAALSETADASDDQGYTYAGEIVAAGAWGVEVDDLDGSFANAEEKSISATATAGLAVDLISTGVTATASAGTLGAHASAFGVLLLEGQHSAENSGTISASATADVRVNASASATDGEGWAFIQGADATAFAVGFSDQGVSDGFTNGGDITATAAGKLAVTLSATGDSGANAYAINHLGVAATGVGFSYPVLGDVVNSGNITATATGEMDLTVSSKTLAVTNVLEVGALGMGVNFGLPEEPEENDDEQASAAAPVPFTYTNDGTITASASLIVNSSVPAVTGEESGAGTAATLNAYGAIIGGDVGTITNSGTIAATGNLSVTGGTDSTIVATVVGLSLPDIGAGGTVINSNVIKADLTGAGASDSVAIGLLLGPLGDEGGQGLGAAAVSVEVTDTGTELPTDTRIYTTAASDVITVTNSGTISATNSMGTSYGIGALFAPVPVVINQQGGSISAEVAIGVFNGNADTLNWTGGEIHGIVDADEFDVVNVFKGTGTPSNNTIVATEDFALLGGAALNIGVEDSPVVFDFGGTALGVGAVNLNADANLVMKPTGVIIGGTFNMTPDSTLTYAFNPTQAGFIGTTGDANIDGTLAAVALPGLYGDHGSHVVMEAEGAVVGTFDNTSITGDTLLLDFSATVGKQDVTISWERTPFNEVAGLTVNSTSVATALEHGYDPTRPASANDPELNDVLSAMFTLTDAQKYDRVLNSWSGSEHAQLMRAAANLAEPYTMAVSEHLNDIRRSGAPDGQVVMLRPKGSSASIAPLSAAGASGGDESRFAFWGRAFGRWASTRGDVEADGYDEDNYGAVLGADFQVSHNVVVGIVGGYLDDDVKFDDGDRGKIKRWTIGGYFSATIDRFYIDGSLSYASDNYRMHRTIVYGDTSCLAFNCTSTASSKYDGDGFVGHAEIGYIFDLGEGTSLQPFAGLNYSSVDSDPFSETGGGDLGLDVLDGTGKTLQSRLGVRLTGEWGSGGVKWVPELRAEWRHEFKDDPAWIAANLQSLPDNPFVMIGSQVTGDLGVIGAGVTALMDNGVGVFFDYQGTFGSGYHSHVVQGGVRVKF